jgi:metal-sulfur cluster biosynthetic enzyme
VWVALGSGPGSTPGPNNQAADFRSYTPTNTASAAAESSPASPASAGSPAAASTPSPGGTTAIAADGVPSEEVVREWLKEVKDPELFVNIVDLGLIYGVTLSPAADAPGKQHVAIDMTMTSPACPAGPQLIADTKRTVGSRESIAAVEVRIVMDPPWTPDRMTDAARDQLGIF